MAVQNTSPRFQTSAFFSMLRYRNLEKASGAANDNDNPFTVLTLNAWTSRFGAFSTLDIPKSVTTGASIPTSLFLKADCAVLCRNGKYRLRAFVRLLWWIHAIMWSLDALSTNAFANRRAWPWCIHLLIQVGRISSESWHMVLERRRTASQNQVRHGSGSAMTLLKRTWLLIITTSTVWHCHQLWRLIDFF